MNLLKKMFTSFFIILLIIVFTGCSYTIELSQSIPFQTQQLIKSIKSDNGIKFQYVPNKKGNNLGTNYSQYNINKPFESLLSELVKTKFGNLNNSSKNTIIITLENVESNDSQGLAGIDLSMRLSVGINLTKDEKVYTNSFQYDFAGSYSNYNSMKSDLDNFLMKYIITIDKYIDTQFTIQ